MEAGRSRGKKKKSGSAIYEGTIPFGVYMSALTRNVIQSIMACIFTHTIYRTKVPVLFFSLTGPSESEVNTPAGLGTNLRYSTVVNWMEGPTRGSECSIWSGMDHSFTHGKGPFTTLRSIGRASTRGRIVVSLFHPC